MIVARSAPDLIWGLWFDHEVPGQARNGFAQCGN